MLLLLRLEKFAILRWREFFWKIKKWSTIPGEPGSKVFCLNGPAAHRGKVGDVVTIMAFSVCTLEEAAVIAPAVIVLNEKNEIVMRKGRARR